MAILKYANQSGVVYAYESISKWDPVKKQSRAIRKCLGRVDPETGEIVPKSLSQGSSKKKKDDGISSDLNQELDKLRVNYDMLKVQNQELIKENKRLKDVLLKIEKTISDARWYKRLKYGNRLF